MAIDHRPHAIVRVIPHHYFIYGWDEHKFLYLPMARLMLVKGTPDE